MLLAQPLRYALYTTLYIWVEDFHTYTSDQSTEYNLYIKF